MKGIRLLRISVILILIGFVLELLVVVSTTPTTFMLFVMVGLPALGLGMLLYLIRVFAVLKRKQAL
ncbi:MAG: hypothetical protein H6744_17630 [Deltaproteobacteria bacterium]|nr:hypothetical protein [Deltaproteobacteria bacterium]